MNHDGCDFQTPLDRRPTESDLVLGDERARARDSFANARSPSIANARRSSTNAMSRARSRRPFVFVRAPKRVRRRRRPRGTCRSRRRGRAIALFWDHFFSKFANFRNSADTKTRDVRSSSSSIVRLLCFGITFFRNSRISGTPRTRKRDTWTWSSSSSTSFEVVRVDASATRRPFVVVL